MQLGPFTLVLTGAMTLGPFSVTTAPDAVINWETSLHDAIYAALKGDAAVSALVSDIYDDVPQRGAVFPYVTIGEASHNAWDTDSDLGISASISIHAWSRYRGRKEVKSVQGAIYSALNRALFAVLGYNLIVCDFERSDTAVESDRLTRHGVQIFNILLDEG